MDDIESVLNRLFHNLFHLTSAFVGSVRWRWRGRPGARPVMRKRIGSMQQRCARAASPAALTAPLSRHARHADC